MRLIDADKLIEQIKEDYCENCNSYHGIKCRACWIDDVMGVVEDAPGFDLVRCKDCKHYMTIHCTCDGCCISDDWYCADGERRTDG